MAKWLDLAQPAGDYGSDAVEGEFGVNVEEALGLAGGEMFFSVEAETALEFGEQRGGQGEADGEGVAAESGEEIGAALDRIEKMEAVDGAAGAVGNFAVGAILDADNDGGLGGALDDTRGEDADDAAMPAFSIDDKEAIGDEFGVGGEALLDDAESGGFSVASLAIEALEFCGEFGGAVRVASGEELDDFGGDVHAAGGVDARGEAEGDVEAGDLLGGGVERGGGEEGAETGTGGAAKLAQAEGGDGAIFAVKRDGVGDGGDGGHFQKAGQSFFAGPLGVASGKDGLCEFESDGGAAERFFGIAAAGLIGIEDGEGDGEGVIGARADGGR